MWSLVKMVVTLGVVGTLGYLACTHPIGGATLAAHLGDIWRSPTVQRKVELVKSEVTAELASKLEQARSQRASSRKTPNEELTERDRAELEALLQRNIE